MRKEIKVDWYDTSWGPAPRFNLNPNIDKNIGVIWDRCREMMLENGIYDKYEDREVRKRYWKKYMALAEVELKRKGVIK